MAFDSFRDLVNALAKAHELIACGLHQRAVIRTESFTRRVQAKAG